MSATAESSSQVEIRRPVAEVWAFVDEPANEPHWQPGAVQRVLLTDRPLGEGSRITQTDLFMGRRFESEWEVVAYDRHLRTDRTTSGGIRVEVTRRVEPIEAGTRFTMAVSARARLGGPLGKMAAAAAVRAAKRDMRAALARLKDLLESS